MAKSLYFRNWLVLAVLLVPTLTTAQKVTEAVDSIKVDPNEDMIIETYYTDDGGTANDTIYLNDEAIDCQKNLPQYDLKEYEWVDICDNPKYAIVTKDGKKGIYDLILHKNITEIEYRDLGFSKQTEAEDSAYISCSMLQKVSSVAWSASMSQLIMSFPSGWMTLMNCIRWVSVRLSTRR